MTEGRIYVTTIRANGKPTVEEVWREFETSLRAYVGRRVADPHRADDVVSEVFLRVHRNLHTLEDDDRLAKWLFTIARNAVTDEYRRAGRLNENLVDAATLDGVDDSVTATDDRDAIAELAACVRPLLRCLPDHYRRAVEVVDLQGVAQVDAARQEGISLSGMKSRVQRGRRELRAVLRECCSVTLDAQGMPLDFAPNGACACGSCSASRQPPSVPSADDARA
jgi:RNA polymerase sigma-70 factor, ECF subfamily